MNVTRSYTSRPISVRRKSTSVILRISPPFQQSAERFSKILVRSRIAENALDSRPAVERLSVTEGARDVLGTAIIVAELDHVLDRAAAGLHPFEIGRETFVVAVDRRAQMRPRAHSDSQLVAPAANCRGEAHVRCRAAIVSSRLKVCQRVCE